MSFKANIVVSRVEAANLKTTVRLIYGHEQRHVQDRVELVKNRLIDDIEKNNGCYRDKDECDTAAENLEITMLAELNRLTSPDPEFVRHDNNKTTLMPADGEPLEPLNNTSPDILIQVGE